MKDNIWFDFATNAVGFCAFCCSKRQN